MNNICIALGRRDINKPEQLEFWTQRGLSQDAWIFKTPIKIPKKSDFNFGIPTCDHHIAYLLKEGRIQIN